MKARITEDRPRCPECGSRSFTVDPTAEVPIVWFIARTQTFEPRPRRATVAFCNECEFCIEVRG